MEWTTGLEHWSGRVHAIHANGYMNSLEWNGTWNGLVTTGLEHWSGRVHAIHANRWEKIDHAHCNN